MSSKGVGLLKWAISIYNATNYEPSFELVLVAVHACGRDNYDRINNLGRLHNYNATYRLLLFSVYKSHLLIDLITILRSDEIVY